MGDQIATTTIGLMAAVLHGRPAELEQELEALQNTALANPGAVFEQLCAVARSARRLADDACELARTIGVHPDHRPSLEDAHTLDATDDEVGAMIREAVSSRVAELAPVLTEAIVKELALDVRAASKLSDPVDRILGYTTGNVWREAASRAASTVIESM